MEEEGTLGFMMWAEGSDGGGGEPGLYDGWKGLAPRAQRKRGSGGTQPSPASAGQKGWTPGWSWGDLPAALGGLGTTLEATGRAGARRQPRLRGNLETVQLR